MGLAKRTEYKCWGQGPRGEKVSPWSPQGRDLRIPDLKVREEEVHHHPLQRAAPPEEKTGEQSWWVSTLVALATSSHTHTGGWLWKHLALAQGFLAQEESLQFSSPPWWSANSGYFDEGILLSQRTRTCPCSDQVLPVKTMTHGLACGPIWTAESRLWKRMGGGAGRA